GGWAGGVPGGGLATAFAGGVPGGGLATAGGAFIAGGTAATIGGGSFFLVRSRMPTTTMPTTASTPTPRSAQIHLGGPAAGAGMRMGAATGEKSAGAANEGSSALPPTPLEGP